MKILNSDLKINIIYCRIANYHLLAQNISNDIKEEFENVKISLFKKGGGVFDIEVDNKLLFSKHIKNRLPKDNEIINLIREFIIGK